MNPPGVENAPAPPSGIRVVREESIAYLGVREYRRLDKAPPVRAAAALLIGLLAIVIWWPAFGTHTLWALPVLGLATASLAGVLPVKTKWQPLLLLAVWAAWSPLAVFTGGTPSTPQSSAIFNGITSWFDNQGAEIGNVYLAWLYMVSATWLVGTELAMRPGRIGGAFSFILLSMPFTTALPFQGHPGGQAWQGGAILAAALLWATRGTLRGSAPAIGGIAVIGALVALAVAPTDKWDSLERSRDSQNTGANGGQTPRSSTDPTAFNSDQTYGPLKNDLTGRTMFEVTAEHAALWRMKTFDSYNGHIWLSSGQKDDDLPQPGATGADIQVRVKALQDKRVVSPGAVLAVSGAGPTKRLDGNAVELDHDTSDGERYSVSALAVRPTAAQLANVPIPTGPEYSRWTTVFPGRSDIPTPVTSIADSLTARYAATGEGQTIRIADELANSSSELAVVERVENYLRSDTFRYTLDVPPTGSQPIIDFITDTHRGYCQHFAGAAALLLRMAGIPTRVATGFSTGVSSGNGVFNVRDEDAHAWIEVYFEGFGWVPFNPTPPGADAAVGENVDVLSPGASGNQGTAVKRRVGNGHDSLIGVVLITFFAGGSLYWWRRARRGQPTPPLGDVLVRLVPPPAGAATTHVEIRTELEKLGPSIAGLAREAELQRFGPELTEPERHPRRRVWRALIRDVGLPRALRLMIFGAPRPPLDPGASSGAFRAVETGTDPVSAAREPVGSVAPPS